MDDGDGSGVVTGVWCEIVDVFLRQTSEVTA